MPLPSFISLPSTSQYYSITFTITFIVITLSCTLASLSGLLSKREVTTRVTELPFAEPAKASSSTFSSPSSSAPLPSLTAPIVDQVVLVVLDALRPDFVFPSLEPFIREGDHECRREDLLRESRLAASLARQQVRNTKNNTINHKTDGDSSPLTPTAAPSSSFASSSSAPATTRPFLTSLYDMLVDNPRDAMATFLIADAPTTTSQRLKAIMTGTIPAFIEGGANFNSDEVIEDNLLLQLNRRHRFEVERRLGAAPSVAVVEGGGGALSSSSSSSSPTASSLAIDKAYAGAVVLGDDTWLTLFSTHHWAEATVFPSFDVRDLDGNDAQVMRHMRRVLVDYHGEGRTAELEARAMNGGSAGHSEGENSDDDAGDGSGRNKKSPMSRALPRPLKANGGVGTAGKAGGTRRGMLSSSSSSASASLSAGVVGDSSGDKKGGGADDKAFSTSHAPLIIMHFLGIDHAGHSYNAYHPEMNRKLTEINGQMASLIAMLEERAAQSNTTTALVVMGDHGMTNSGDHGGDFSQETDTIAITRVFRGGASGAARPTADGTNGSTSSSHSHLLVALQRAACLHDRAARGRDAHATCRFMQCADVVSAADSDHTSSSSLPFPIGAAYQIDIVPTLAALLGIGMPFSNMGSVIPEVIGLVVGGGAADGPSSASSSPLAAGHSLLGAVRRNYHQMLTYLSSSQEEEASEGDAPSRNSADAFPPPNAADALTLEALAPFMRHGMPSTSPSPVGGDFSDGDGALPALFLSSMHYLRSMASLASGVRRSRAQMKVDRIFVGAVCGMLWCVASLAYYYFTGRWWRRSPLCAPQRGAPIPISHPRNGNAPLVTLIAASASLGMVGLGIVLDVTLLVLLGAVVALGAGLLLIIGVGGGGGTLEGTAVGGGPTHRGSTSSPPISSSLSASLMFPSLVATVGLTIVRIIPPFSNSFVVFEDTIVQWLVCLVVAVAVMCTPPSHRHCTGPATAPTAASSPHPSSARRIASAIGVCVLTRLLMACGVRSRRHHTHTIEALSPLDAYLSNAHGWDGNLKGTMVNSLWSSGGMDDADGRGASSSSSAVLGTTVFDLYYRTLHMSDEDARDGFAANTFKKHFNYYALGSLSIRFVFNFVCAAGLLVSLSRGDGWPSSRRGRGSGLLLSLLVAVWMTLVEHIPIVHHIGGVGGAALLFIFARTCCSSSPPSSSLSAALWRKAPIALVLVWASTLSTTPSARLTAALGPLVIRLGAAVVRPFALSSSSSSSSFSSPSLLPPLAPLLLHLLGWSLFFAGGQQTVLSTLDWGAAFVGVGGYNLVACALLVVVRTFGPFMASAVLPVVLWGADGGADADGDGGGGLTRAGSSTAPASSSDDSAAAAVSYRAFLFGMLLLQALMAAASTLAAGVLRMHLMMWAIFCPKMLYDVILMGLMCVVVCVGMACLRLGRRHGDGARQHSE